MPDNQTLSEKYAELVAAGYIKPVHPPMPMEMISAFVYVPVYDTDHTVPYKDTSYRESRHGQLDRHSERDQ
jgi:hypothetical protein